MPDGGDTHEPTVSQRLPRAFTDARGARWTVREITLGPIPPKLRALLGEERRDGAWLLFLSDVGEKRRLAPVPNGWAGLSDGELEALCTRVAGVGG